MADTSGFVTGDDFISFDVPSAGPSRSGGAPPSPPSDIELDDDDNNMMLAGLTRSPPRGWKGKAREVDGSSGVSTPVSTPPADASRPGNKRKSIGAAPDNKRAKADAYSTGPRNLKEERKAAERAAPWAEDVRWESCVDSAEMLNDEIHAFYNYMAPTTAESRVRANMIDLIANTVTDQWPDAEVLPFGSWQTALYLPTGDIDLVVTTPQMTEKSKPRLLRDLAGMMRRANITNVVAVIAKAKVPIIKFVTEDGKINVDISLNHPETVSNGVQAAKIIQHYLDDLPGARELILVVKAFLSQRSMNEVYTGGLGSYSVICLVISFLQLHPKLRRSEMDARKNLGTLLCEFFELYGRNFNYDDVGISIRKGGAYYAKRARGWHNFNNQPFLLSIEDPQDPDNNDVARSSHGIRQVKMTLGGAYEVLTATLFERATLIKSRKERGEHDPIDAQEASILSTVMGVTRETQRFRRDLTQLDASGRLKGKLNLLLRRMGSRATIVSSDGARGGGAREAASRSGADTSAARIRVDRTPPPATRADDRDHDPLGAILVDDGDAASDSDSDSDSNSNSSDGSASGASSTSFRPQSRNNNGNGNRGSLAGRFGSVSEDDIEEGEIDSKYATHAAGKKSRAAEKKRRAKQRKRERAAAAAKATPAAPHHSDGELGGGAAEKKEEKSRRRKKGKKAASAPGSKMPSRDGSPAAAGSSGKLTVAGRKAFWAAKGGQNAPIEVADSD